MESAEEELRTYKSYIFDQYNYHEYSLSHYLSVLSTFATN